MRPLVDVLLRTRSFFAEKGIPSPALEADLVVGHVLGLDRLQLYLAHDRPLTEAELDTLRVLVARRGKREPLAYVLGRADFHAITVELGPGVLIPRPDTETVVEALLDAVPADADPVYVADVGCGPGTIGLAIATARPGARIYAVDLSPDALRWTRHNVARLGLGSRVAVLEGDLLDPIPAARPIDWVVSNPPYVRAGEIDGLMPEVSRFEPRLALDGGVDGLDVYRRLLPAAARRARVGVIVEVGYDQAAEVAALARAAGLVDVHTRDDLAGIARVVTGLLSSR